MGGHVTDDEFNQFRNVIYEASGINFTSSNRSILESRLRERLRSSGVESLSQYYRRIRSDPDELKVLLDTVTTNLTRFFRNTAHIQTFEHAVLPDLIDYKNKHNDRRVRMWSAGCSTGEEPYTMAMVAREVLPASMRVEIIASDISLKSLMIAREGLYPSARVDHVPQKYLDKYFTKKPSGYQINKEIMDLVTFDYHNLKHDSGLRNLDVVFCRNVLIYFDEVAQQNTVQRIWDAMGPYSYLFIGHSESLFGMDTRFEFHRTDWASVYRKRVM
ncbi:MAG: CheR family methyltransferase [Spirochaetaceae bacterium]